MHIVTSTQDLRTVCARFSSDDFITVDTEFMRETTYWPILCLIQIAGRSDAVIVDPLAENLSLDPFMQLMANKEVRKVFHSARQDVEIIHYLGGVIPEPIFDTQVAAMVCGLGDSIGYENIVRQLIGASIDKSSRFTDWSRRPLSDKQLRYALSDVTHLRQVYEKLEESLNRSNRESWLAEEMTTLTSPETYESKPENAWKRLKFKARNKTSMAVFMSVAAWREREAQRRDVPRNRVLKEDALAELAVQAPRTSEDLARLRALPRGFARSRHAESLLRAVADGTNMDPADIPSVKRDDRPSTPAPASVVELLKVTLKHVCELHGVAPRLVANVSDLEEIALDDRARVKALGGWRRKVFGDAALDVKHGKLSVALENGEVVLEPRRKIGARAAE